MGEWQLVLSAEALRRVDRAAPIFVRVATLICAEVRRGRLRPGDRLPGTRPLGKQLGVNRNTIVAAYQELHSEGWIVTRPAGGTFVSERLPEIAPRAFSRRDPRVPERPGFEVEPRRPQPAPVELPADGLALFGGIPDLRLVPVAELARAYRRALRARDRRVLDYADAAGHPDLREAVSGLLRTTRGLAVASEHVVITRGSQMALDLLSRTLLRPGDRVAVEELGYQPAWGAFRLSGAELVHIPLDSHGMDVDALRAELRRGPLRAIYLTPHHQYPTTVSLSPGRRIELLELAAREKIAVFEDDYDHQFHYEGRPLMPLASADTAGVVVYVGTLSKILAPGLRLGFVVAPVSLARSIAELRALVDRQGDLAIEAAVAELMADGIVERHARRMRRAYRARRDAFVDLLREHLGEALSFDIPAGGMALWARARRGIDVRRWCARSREHGVHFITGDRYVGSSASAARVRHWQRYLRLGFARYDERELSQAVKRMAQALSDIA